MQCHNKKCLKVSAASAIAVKLVKCQMNTVHFLCVTVSDGYFPESLLFLEDVVLMTLPLLIPKCKS